ncbi:hypothetical protein NQZ68_029522 [Dissostichus eleginoides]|nr:hypothetical protein NQZ68_029522 [Dissostichus eleginoides]
MAAGSRDQAVVSVEGFSSFLHAGAESRSARELSLLPGGAVLIIPQPAQSIPRGVQQLLHEESPDGLLAPQLQLEEEI